VRERTRLPDPVLDLVPGELVHYRRWCPNSHTWVTDGVPLLVVEVLRDGMAAILTDNGVVCMPITILKRSETSFDFFASVV